LCGGYSDRSASVASTRAALAAGSADAITAASSRTATLRITGTGLGEEVAVRQPGQSVPAHRARHDSGDGHCRTFGDHSCEQPDGRCPDRQTDAEFTRSPADGESQHAGHAHDGNQQGHRRESAEHHGVQPVRRQHFRAYVFQRGRALHRLVHGHVSHDARDRRHQRVRIHAGVHEQAPAK